MKALVLDGFNEPCDLQARIMEGVSAELAARGWEATILTLRGMELAPCTGCFGCWTQRPGKCVQEDHAHDLCQEIIDSELLLTISPVTFGGYSSVTKTAMDRTIGLVSPFFTMVGGEVHHEPRYERMPAMAVLGINHDGCQRCDAIFRALIYRNAINFHPPAVAVEVAREEELSGEGARARVAGLLDRTVSLTLSDLPVETIGRSDFAAEPLPLPLPDPSRGSDRSILILTGSPKAQSTSSSIGGELAQRMEARGWRTKTMKAVMSLNTDGTWQRLLEALDEADLVALVAPLYVDSLPAPVTEALEGIARHRRSQPSGRQQGLLAIVNSGFPEDFHNYTALAIARRFAEETGYAWMGGLPLGMGGAIDARPLAECGRMVRNVVKALDLTAASLDRGEVIPSRAVELMGKPVIPRWLYIAMGNWGWKRRAKKYGVREHLYARPYERKS